MRVSITGPIKLHDSESLSTRSVETLGPGIHTVEIVANPGDYAGIWLLRKGSTIGAPQHVWRATPGFKVVEDDE